MKSAVALCLLSVPALAQTNSVGPAVEAFMLNGSSWQPLTSSYLPALPVTALDGAPAVELYCLNTSINKWVPFTAANCGGGGGTSGVTTFNTRSGAVTPQAADYSAFYDAAGAAAGIVQQVNRFPLRQEFGDAAGTDEIFNIGYNGQCLGFNRNTDTGVIYNSAGQGFQVCHFLNSAASSDIFSIASFLSGGGSSTPFQITASGVVSFGAAQQASFSTAGALTAPSVDGVSATTLGYVDPTSSIQTQLNGTAQIAGANTFTAKQTFTGTTALPPFNIVGTAADPTTVNNGDLWYNTTSTRLAFKAGGISRGLTYTNDAAVGFTGGSINGTTIGASTPSSGRFTSIVQSNAENVVTFSATPAFLNTYQSNTIVLTGNVTSWTLPNGTAGQQPVVLNVCQDATGARTFSGAPANVRGFGTIGATASKCNEATGTWFPSQSAWIFSVINSNL